MTRKQITTTEINMTKRTLTAEELNGLSRMGAYVTGTLIGELERAGLVTLKQLYEAETYEAGYELLNAARENATGEACTWLEKIYPYLCKNVNIVCAIYDATMKFYEEEWSTY